MAFTKVTNAGIGSTNTVLLHNLNVVGTVTATDGIFSGIGSFGGNVSVGGVLTYEDVTNVDSVGLITARKGISVLGAGVTIAGGGLNVTAGVSTFGGNVTVGSGITLSPDGDGYYTGIVTATTFKGALTGSVTGAATKITVTDQSADTTCNVLFAQGETGDITPHTGTNLTFNSSTGALTATSFVGSGENLTGIDADKIQEGNSYAEILDTGSNGIFRFLPEDSEVFRIATNGHVGINTNNPIQDLTIFADGPNIRLTHGGTTNQNNSGYIHVDETGMEFNSYQEVTATRRPITFVQYTDERLRIDGNGKLLVGKNSAYGSGLTQVHAAGQYALDVATWSADANGPTIDFYKSRSATKGTMTVVQDDDVVGRLRFLGADGSNGRTAAQITAHVDGTPGTNDMPGRLVFATTADGASSASARMTIKSDGRIGINKTSPSAYLHIDVGGIDSDVPGLKIHMNGTGGGTSGEQYGLSITGGGYNNATHIYGIHVDKTQQLTQHTTAGYFKSSAVYNTIVGSRCIGSCTDTGAGGTTYGVYATAEGSSGSAKTKNGYGIWAESTGTNFATTVAAKLKTVAGSSIIYGLVYNHDGNDKFRVDSAGGVWSANNSYSSDRDLKDNIINLSGTSLDKIKQLTPRQFTWKLGEDITESDTLTGFIAQEVEPILPDIVTGTDGSKEMGINYNGLVAHLVNAVKELSDEVNQLKSQINN